MDTKKYFAAFLAAAMMCSAAVSCSSEGSSSKQQASSDAETTAAQGDAADEVEETTAPPDLEEAVEAKSGEAYLAINESQGWCKYFGKSDDMLAYGAGVVPINGNGSYTVSITADTNGFRYDTTKDIEDTSVTPAGLMFSALMIRDGNILFPDAVLTIDSIRVDGKELELTAKNYTSSDDGVELRSNIFNEWVSELPNDAKSTEGELKPGGKFVAAADAYSPCIVDSKDFSSWTTVEVDFTVSGIE